MDRGGEAVSGQGGGGGEGTGGEAVSGQMEVNKREKQGKGG